MNSDFDATLVLPKIHQLPVIPSAITEITSVISDAGASSGDVERAISQDQAVTGKVLKVVNSAYYGFSRRIETVNEASVLLGFRKLGDIAITMATAELFRDEPGGLIEGKRLWVHGLATSFWARKILAYKRIHGKRVAVTAALLHDIGIMILHQYCREAYQEVLETARAQNRHHVRVEKEMLKTTHAKIGAQLCVRWQLPSSLTNLIHSHHSMFAIYNPEMAVLSLADHLANEHGYGPFEWGRTHDVNENVFPLLDFSSDDMERILEMKPELDEEIAAFSAMVFPGEENT